MRWKSVPLANRQRSLVVLVVLLSAFSAWGAQWKALGPEGGDVRSLSADPQDHNHIFLGTSTGTIFTSVDGGRTWSRHAHLGDGNDYVIDHIVIDPQNPKQVYAAAWSVEDQDAGDLFHSQDGGNSWAIFPAMHGKSIRALTVALYDSKVLVAGTLDGVFRSVDSGANWQRISESNLEIHNVESLALDPHNPDVVYAGTRHLAWKTEDGGANWRHIDKGMIDDSDVFSIFVDSSNSSVVFASACSGVFKSENAGDLFQKIQGIPFSSRRTRVLKQDPKNPAVIYAGTTEGLWKTLDGGKNWKRTTSPEIVVNDVLVDVFDPQRVLLATDRGGVLASDDGAETFVASNRGFSHRYVTAMLVDKQDANTIYVGVVNDREVGGVFISHDGGEHWSQQSMGLHEHDVFALAQAESGELVAGTNRGMFSRNPGTADWVPINNIVQGSSPAPSTAGVRKDAHSILTARVNSILITPKRWLAATSDGLYVSTDRGKRWIGPVMGRQNLLTAQQDGDLLAVASSSALLVSTNTGVSWKQTELPSFIHGIRNITLTPDGQIIVASNGGAFRSSDFGDSWEHMTRGLPNKDISSIIYDSGSKTLFATSMETGVVLESRDLGKTWRYAGDAGYALRSVSIVRGSFVAATAFDGVIEGTENGAWNSAANHARDTN
jgi:photosystem II stability/assembly factor-like uncharacterized protein